MDIKDLDLLYHYIHKGPKHPDASAGVCIGGNLSRPERTEVYRYLSNVYRNLESKTVDFKKQAFYLPIYSLIFRRNV